MSYIGVEPTKGQYRKLTDISSAFNGTTTTFQLSVPPGDVNSYVSVSSPQQLIISVGGVVQNPGVAYITSGNQITFTTAPASGLSFFGTVLGDSSTNVSASSITFQNTGTGAIQRTIDSKLKDVVSVRDFGAVGDGTTDDTAAIQAALNAAISANVPLHFGNGVFYHANQIAYTVTQDNRRIRILLDGATLKAGALDITALNIKGSTYRPPLSIYGPGRLLGTNLIIIPGVASGSYLNVENFDQVLISGIEFDSGARASGKGDSGIVVSSCGDAKIEGCHFRGWNDHGIYFTGSAVGTTQRAIDAVVTGCTFNDVSGAIRWARSATNLAVVGNIFKDVYNGVIIAGGASNHNPGNTIVVTGNLFDGCDASAIDARYFSTGINITGNSIYDWGKTVSTAAINLRGVANSVVSGNIIGTKNPTNATPATNLRCALGIYIQSATNDDLTPPDDTYLWPAINNIISDNFFYILQADNAIGGRNAAIADMVGDGSNFYVFNKIITGGSSFSYYVNSFGSNVFLGSPWLLHPSATGFGIGTDNPQGPLHVIGDSIVGRKANTTQFIRSKSIAGGNQITSLSTTSSANKLFINATTDDSDTTPTGGAVGLNLRVLNLDKVACNVDDVLLTVPLRLKAYSTTAALPTTNISAGTIAYDSQTSTVKFYNGSVWANI